MLCAVIFFVATFPFCNTRSGTSKSKNYIEKRMFGKSKNVDLKEICKDDLVFVDYPGKSNTYYYGRVEEVVGSDAKIVFRNHNTKTIPIANLYPLSQAKHSMVNNSF